MSPDEKEMKEREEFLLRSEASVKAMLRAKSWEEKVRSIERMREFDKVAKGAMRRTLEGAGRASCESTRESPHLNR